VFERLLLLLSSSSSSQGLFSGPVLRVLAAYLMATMGSFPGVKQSACEVRCYMYMSANLHLTPSLRMQGAIPPVTYMSSCCGARITSVTNCLLWQVGSLVIV